MKNIFEEKQKKKTYWKNLSPEMKFEILKIFTQVHGGEVDDELECIFLRDFIDRGVLSVKFIETLISGIEKGNRIMLNAGY